MAIFELCAGWRLSGDGELQWMLQHEQPGAKDERSRWKSVAYCGSLEGLLAAALPRHRVNVTDAARGLLKRLPANYQPGALAALSMATARAA